MKKNDWILCGIITFIYAIVAFYNLGDKFAPESMLVMHKGDTLYIELEDATEISRIQYYLGPKEDAAFSIAISADGNMWDEYEIEVRYVFAWKEYPFNSFGRYIKITALSDIVMIQEMAFRDGFDNLIDIFSENALFDEQWTVPTYGYYMNSTYFDEIYHARTAYEMINQLRIYEWTHPPLGKVIIGAGIRVFGMNPFGWRFMGAFTGVCMVPLIYFFAKKMFQDKFFAGFAAVIFAFDFMHFTQTRIATIDTYTTFFTIAMYFCMYLYLDRDCKGNQSSKALIPLGLCGLFTALNIAVKWQGVYAAAGIAVLFFIHHYLKYTEFRQKTVKTSDIKKFQKNFACTIGFCLIFFIAIPVIVYLASHWMYFNTPGYNTIGDIIDLQKNMYAYHANLESVHNYASPWWSWPIMQRPVFYYTHSYDEAIKAGISAFGNPAVWWIGIAAFVYTLIDYLKNKSRISLFLIIAYAAQYLPWALIDRTIYIYHYFPSVPFVVLMLTFMFKNAFGRFNKKLSVVYVSIVILLFILFYPVLSGAPVRADYVVNKLRWLPTWQLIIE